MPLPHEKSLKEIEVEQAIALTDELLYQHTKHHLSAVQAVILREAWIGSRKTYEQLAEEMQYSANYIKQGVGPKLWRTLSEIVGERVTKGTAKTALSQYFSLVTSLASHPTGVEHPCGVVALQSPFYIQRGNSDRLCLQTIGSPGAFIRIKAPRKTGKTSLLNRILAHAQSLGCETVLLNFQQAEAAVLSDINRLLRWVCANLSFQLGRPADLDQYWGDDIGSKMSCNLFLQSHILAQRQAAEPIPLVVAFEEVHELLAYPDVAHEFLTLLRFWHERVKVDEQWQPLRLIMVHSTEIYLALDTNQSPLNVGLGVDLQPFNSQEVKRLVHSHSLNLGSDEINQLVTLTGGHPYLVRLTLYHLATQDLSLAEINATAATETGIYHSHLHRHLRHLEQYPDIAAAFLAVLSTASTGEISQIHGFKLQSLGLVTLTENKARVSCELYQRYFRDRLPPQNRA